MPCSENSLNNLYWNDNFPDEISNFAKNSWLFWRNMSYLSYYTIATTCLAQSYPTCWDCFRAAVLMVCHFITCDTQRTQNFAWGAGGKGRESRLKRRWKENNSKLVTMAFALSHSHSRSRSRNSLAKFVYSISWNIEAANVLSTSFTNSEREFMNFNSIEIETNCILVAHRTQIPNPKFQTIMPCPCLCEAEPSR